MDKKHREMVAQGVHILNTLGVKCMDIMLCGSITFDIFGIYPKERGLAHDVDFVVRTDAKQKEKILEVFKMYEKMTEPEKVFHQADYPTAVIKVNGLVLNVWFIDEKEDFDTTMRLSIPNMMGEKYISEEIWIAKLSDTLEEKRRYNRAKDLEDKINITKLILG